jgi:hypothetical protein
MSALRDALKAEELEDLIRRGRRSTPDWALVHITHLLGQHATSNSHS